MKINQISFSKKKKKKKKTKFNHMHELSFWIFFFFFWEKDFQPMVSTSNDNHLSSDQDTNKFLV